MPKTKVVLFQRTDGSTPARVRAKCIVRLERLAECGHELRRPEADYLWHGLYELGVRDQRVRYRILYFFHGRNVAVIVHGFTKLSVVPRAEIDTAIKRKEQFEQDPEGHTYRG